MFWGYNAIFTFLMGASTLEVWLNFVASLVDSLAWPSAIVIVAVLFKQQIFLLLKRIRKASYGDAEVEFDKQLDEAESKVAELTPPTSQDEPDELSDSGFEKSAKQSPRLAVLNDWIRIEEAVSRLAGSKGYTGPRAKSFSYAFRHLSRDGVIGDDLNEVISELRRLRNLAVHGDTGSDISFEEAERFHEMAISVTRRISSLI